MDPNREHDHGRQVEQTEARGSWERFVGVLTRPPRRRRLDGYAATAVTLAALINIAVVAGLDDPAAWRLGLLGIIIGAALATWADVLPDRLARGAVPLRVLAAAVGVAAVVIWVIAGLD